MDSGKGKKRAGSLPRRFNRALSWIDAIGSIWARQRLALDIGDQSLRFLVTKGHRVRKWGTLELPEGVVVNGAIRAPETFNWELSEFLRASGVKAQDVSWAISDPAALVRMVTLPPLKKEEVKYAAFREIQRLSLVPEEHVCWDWRLLKQADGRQGVLLMTALRHSAETNAQAIALANLRPKFATLKGLALWRGVSEGQAQAAILNVEPEGVNIALIYGHAPVVARSAFHNAPQGLNESQWLEMILREWRLALDAIPDQCREEISSGGCPLIITGLGAQDQAFAQNIESKLGIPMEPFLTNFGHPEGFPAAEYAVCLGLAEIQKRCSFWFGRRSRRSSRVMPLDVLPQEQRPQSYRMRRRVAGGALAIAGLALLPFYYANASMSQEREAIEQQLALEERKAQRHMSQQRLAQSRNAELDGINQSIRELEAVLAQISTPPLFIGDKLASTLAIDPEVTLTGWRMDMREGEIQGEAPNPDIVFRYVDRLRAEKVFQRVTLKQMNVGSSVADQSRRFQFAISVVQ